MSSANAGAAVTLDTAQELVVRLPIESTSGLEWTLVDTKPGVLGVTGSKFEREPRDTNIGEASGSVVWRFRPTSAGRVTLNFELRRPRSLQPPVQSVTYDVTVR